MPRGRVPLLTLILCAALGILFASISYSTLLTKSATLDEPLHTASAYAATYLHDYRLDPENPPLWKYFMALTLRRDALRLDLGHPEWSAAVNDPAQAWGWTRRQFYYTPGNDGVTVINAARGAMLLVALAAFALAAWWAYRVAGPAAAIAAAVLLAFDPTFLAHAAIIKNDVWMALLMLALVSGLWHATKRIAVANVAVIALSCAVAVNVKFSGLLWPIIAVVTLLVLSKGTWGRRVTIAVVVSLIIAATCLFMTWASYRFRYSVAPDPTVQFDLQKVIAQIAERKKSGESPGLMVQTVLFVDRHRLLPQSWSAGFLGTVRAMAAHQNYLLGEIREMGWWYYFPLAFVFKTPLTTLLAIAGACALLVTPRWRRRLDLNDDLTRALMCIAIATGIYLLSAATQNINHGVRHLLPIIPLICIAVATIFARVFAARRKPAVVTGSVLAVLLAIEVLPRYPNFIQYFNLPADPHKFHLLGDSNLDWGQDLPLVADWRKRNPREPLYLVYYGTAVPETYGIDHTIGFVGPPDFSSPPGVVAISATRLQGLYTDPQSSRNFRSMQTWPLREVLGDGTIYLLEYPPTRKE